MELQNLFTAVLNMSVTGSIVILCVLAARLALKKAPRALSCVLWLVVLLRLLCPVSLTAPVSVLGFVDAPMAESGTVEYVSMPVQAPTETIRVEPGQMVPSAETVPAPAKAPIDWNLMASRVWIGGVAALSAYGMISYVNLKRKLRESVPLGKGIREADGIATPFVLGRTIYLPAGLPAEERGYILLHEQHHIRHGDPAVKLLFWAAVCLHWFNPLVWLAFLLCERDMELRCDEAVLRQCGAQVRSSYAQSLLDCAAGGRFAPAPLAFGEGDTGRRVKFVLGWKKTKLWIAIPAAVLCAAVLVLTACNPADQAESPFGHSYRAQQISASAEYPEVIDDTTMYTLTSDQGLFLRSDKTELAGFFREASGDYDEIPGMPEHMKLGKLRRSYRIEENNWWLLELEAGELRLYDSARGILYRLARTDLLGVSIRQPGIESYVEPVWVRPGDWSWLPQEMVSTVLVDGDARIILMPEQDVEMILVSEEYYELLRNGEYAITVSEHFLERDAKGDFALEVSRRGTAGDDFAVYRVTVGEEQYLFRLTFPVIPGETTVAIGIPEQTREVTYAEHGVSITLSLPESWSYAITSIDAQELNAGISGGITIWPLGREEGKLFFGYYPDKFAVCGTGLQTTETILAGQKVTVGTYDDRPLWDYISFGEYFAVWGQNHESWWAEYGDAAMEILDTAAFSTQGIDLSKAMDGDWVCQLPISPTEP